MGRERGGEGRREKEGKMSGKKRKREREKREIGKARKKRMEMHGNRGVHKVCGCTIPGLRKIVWENDDTEKNERRKIQNKDINQNDPKWPSPFSNRSTQNVPKLHHLKLGRKLGNFLKSSRLQPLYCFMIPTEGLV